MEHPRSKLPAVLVVLFCIALLAGVGVLLWKTLPEKQEPAQAEAIQTDGVFSSEPTTVEPEREEPYEGDLPGQAEAAQPENPDEQPQENPEDQNHPEVPDNMTVSAAGQTAQALLDTMTDDEKLWQLFFVTPEAITNVDTATVAGETTKKALEQYPVGGIVYFAKNLEDREQTVALLENTQSYAKIPLFLGVDEEGGTVSRVGSNPEMGVPSVGDMRSLGKQQDPAVVHAAGQDIGGGLHALGFNLDFAPVAASRRARTASSAAVRSVLTRSCVRRWPVSLSRVCAPRVSSHALSTSPAMAAPPLTTTTAPRSSKSPSANWKPAI